VRVASSHAGSFPSDASLAAPWSPLPPFECCSIITLHAQIETRKRLLASAVLLLSTYNICSTMPEVGNKRTSGEQGLADDGAEGL
jgi:hypothetical protein